jgi:hypothetical protein
MSEQIRIMQSNNRLSSWEPLNFGNEVLGLLQFMNRNNNLVQQNGMPTDVGNQIIQETTNILSLCGSPQIDSYNETGLVLGYVQSGKTLSFTTLSAMARDNDYQLIIVIAGTSTPLSVQTTERLKRDLRLNERTDRRWTLIPNPKTNDHRNTIRLALEQWSDPICPRNTCRTLLITVMKNGKNLQNLYRALQSLELNAVPTLIIDDEGDQASLNTNARRAANDGRPLTEVQASTIYRRISEIRSLLPHHTFLQYTATPQAPLFINIMDRLSPNFIKLLTPGDDYTGGKTFFIDNPRLVIPIPEGDIESDENILDSAPDSLKKALRIFFLGTAVGLLQNLGGNRTMMIHPSRTTGQHNEYKHWVDNIVHSWNRLLAMPKTDPDIIQLLEEFRLDYEDLRITVHNLPDFDIFTNDSYLLRAIRYTQRIEVNARGGRTPEIPWGDNYSFILIGGQALDRGFTVEGLTVTYMPRNLGTGNVDTVLQRARFFGYKRKYLGFCRIFLGQTTIDAYRHIIRHEEDVRARLLDFDVDNRHLNQLDRVAVLHEMLNLTRRNVIFNDLERDRFGINKWFRIYAPHDTPELIEQNRIAVFEFLQAHKTSFSNNVDVNDKTVDQRHLMAVLTLRECLQNLLNQLRFTRESESLTYTTLRSLLTDEVENNSNAECLIYLMRANDIDNWVAGERTLTNKDVIEPFQGPAMPTYHGDIQMRDNNRLTIQVHLLNLKEDGNIIYNNVPTLAIWIPSTLETHIIRQPTNQE